MGKIFAGLLFVFLHFKINGFDLLPDFVGYVLIWRGMKSVPECTSWQKSWAAVAAVASVAMFGVSLVGIRFPGVMGTGVNLVITALHMAVTFDIVRGLEELEQLSGADLQAVWLRKVWYIILIATAAGYAGSLLRSAGIVSFASILAMVGIVCYLVGAYKAWRGYDAWRSEPPIL